MRAGPLSNRHIIQVLNQSFISVYVVNDEHFGNGSAPADERNELRRIQHEGHAKKLSVGTVHAYVLTPDGHTHDSLPVAAAADPWKTVATLQRAAAQFKPSPGKPIVPTAAQSAPPPAPADAITLRAVSARILTYFYPQTENNDARIETAKANMPSRRRRHSGPSRA